MHVVVAGIINTQGALWKDQRKFLYDKLRNFGMTYTGMGKRLMESRIMVSKLGFGFDVRSANSNRPILSYLSDRSKVSDTRYLIGCSLSVAICRHSDHRGVLERG